MIDPGQIGSEAFRRLDVFMSEPADDCEQAPEWLPLFSAQDWRLLETVWPERSAAWRANCARILSHFPGRSSQPILRLALADTNDLVAAEAAVALCGQMLQHPLLVPFDFSLVPRLQELMRGERGRNLVEVDEVLCLHGAAG